MKIDHPIPPCFDEHSEILILGSFPSVKSREQKFFYGHPKNRFWEVLARVLSSETGSDIPVPTDIPEKKAFLSEHHIALWDVIASCEIEGSSDASIRSVIPNDLSRILDHAPIRKIFCNGGKAFDLYEKYLLPVTGREAVKLPSSSPANAAWSVDKLTNCWRDTIFPTIFCPPYPSETEVCLIGSRDEAEAVFENLRHCPGLEGRLPVLISAAVPDWNRDLSPWPAEKVFRGGEDFSGQADAFLSDLLDKLAVAEEALLRDGRLSTAPVRILAGYSLAGLFSVYAMFKTDCFDRFVSASGSLWFDGFLDYAKTHDFMRKPDFVYLSLGDREKIAKNPRMKTVEACTETFRDLLTERSVPAAFVLNPGNHFNDPAGRLSSGIRSAVLSE